MLGTDICYAPVLDFDEAQAHPHNAERQTFVQVDGIAQAAPAPRFDRTVPEVPSTAVAPGENSEDILQAAGFSQNEIDALKTSGAVA